MDASLNIPLNFIDRNAHFMIFCFLFFFHLHLHDLFKLLNVHTWEKHSGEKKSWQKANIFMNFCEKFITKAPWVKAQREKY